MLKSFRYRCLRSGLRSGFLPTLCRQFLIDGFTVNLTYRTYLVVTLFKVDEPYTLCGTSHDAEIGNAYAECDTGLVDDNQIIVIGNCLN